MTSTTLIHVTKSQNPLSPQEGVITLSGYGIQARVDRGHLLLEDGVGGSRRRARFSRVGHGLKRLVVVGSDGNISLAALRWLADQDASFVMLDRNGFVIATSGPVSPSDARLRRAQALAAQTGSDLKIARELISRKLGGQERVVRDYLCNAEAARIIASFAAELEKADSLDAVRVAESRAAGAYWAAWRMMPISFPRNDWPRVPDHWQVFGTRKSEISGSQRLATNPANTMLNYLYAVLEAECRLALATLGLDPGLGVIHMDTPRRDSLACDLMEAFRPRIDLFVLDWIARQPLRRAWFFEERNGNCRLTNSFAEQLAQTAPRWAQEIGPMAEWICKTFWSAMRSNGDSPATRLTQTSRKLVHDPSIQPAQSPEFRPKRLCQYCGKPVRIGKRFCQDCGRTFSTEQMIETARQGRLTCQSAEAQAKRASTQRRQAIERSSWDSSRQPTWLSADVYKRELFPRLRQVTVAAIASALSVSEVYASNIRSGKRKPHPRHWQALAKLSGIFRKKNSTH